MQVLEKLKIKPILQDKNVRFQVVILNVELNKNLKNTSILGRSVIDWIAFACSGIDVRVVSYDSRLSPLEFVMDKIDKNFDYTILLMSTIPLIRASTIREIQEYATFKRVALCKLPVGYVFNNEMLKNDHNLSVDSVYSQNIEDFYVVENRKQFGYAEEVLQDRINTFHIDNGVEIKKPKSVYIEPSVDIDRGVVICAGNTLKGNSRIEKQVILKENNIIESAVVGEGSCLSSSCVKNSRLGPGVYVSAFCEIENAKIGNDVLIGSGCKIYNTTITKDSKIAPNTVLGENNDSDSGTR